jgi:ribosomal protein S18 acetylase RimI-like enzyme
MIENLKFGPCGTPYQDEEDEYVKIWEDGEKGIVAITICKPSEQSRILIHPDYRTHEEMLIESLENRVKKMQIDKPKKGIFFTVQAGDALREALLEKRGYENRGLCEHNRFLPANYEVPDVNLPDGYSIRHIDPEKDFEQYREVQRAVFSHCANMTPELLKMYASAQFYDAYRDVVVVAPDGRFAAFATGRMDPVSKLAELEPVGVHPDYRKRGLGKAICYEAIKRLQEHGAMRIVILGAASSEAATRLYDSIGFERADVNLWVLRFN